MTDAAWGRACLPMGLAIGLAISRISGAAAETNVLAVSRAQHARVLAEGAPAWCAARLRLTLELDAESPAHGDAVAQARLLSKLRRPIETDCPAARSAMASVAGEPAAQFAASEEGGWVFTLTRPAAPPAVAAAPHIGANAPPAATLETRTPPTPGPTIPAAPAPLVLPRDMNYPSLVVALLQRRPELLSDQQVTRYWASYRFPEQFRRLANQEFEIQPLLQQARSDLRATIASAPRDQLAVTLAAQFGSFDFARHQFPLPAMGNVLSFGMSPCCEPGETLPRAVQITIDGLAAIDGIPMADDAASRFAKSRTRYGATDRSVTLLLALALDDKGLVAGLYGQTTASARLQSADALAGHDLETMVHRYPPAELAAMRATSDHAKAAAALQVKAVQEAQQRALERQQAEQSRQILLSQAQELTDQLGHLPDAARLRAFMTPGPYINGQNLNALRGARADALLNGRGADVVMLVQTDGGGTTRVATTWPGHLAVSAKKGAPAFIAAHWYLLAGNLTLPAGEDLPPAILQAIQIYPCKSDMCRDAAKPKAVVDRKLASLGTAVSPSP